MTFEDSTDEQLMAQISLGNELAFRELLNRYSKPVYAFAWRLAGNDSDAEDLTQELFIKVWKNRKPWEERAKLSTWLFRILYNLFIDSKRRSRPMEPLAPDMPSDQESAEHAMMKKDETARVAQAVNSLPDRQKEALVLCYHQGFKAFEAAEMMNLSLGALESLLFRARRTLKETLLEQEKKP